MVTTGIRITGVDKLRLQIRRKGDTPRSYRVAVGYEAPYAIFVHENLEANHPNGGQAKFLEEPARTERNAMARIIKNVARRKGNTIKDAIQAAADYLLSKSPPLVPVDTGSLYLSGYSKAVNYAVPSWGNK